MGLPPGYYLLNSGIMAEKWQQHYHRGYVRCRTLRTWSGTSFSKLYTIAVVTVAACLSAHRPLALSHPRTAPTVHVCIASWRHAALRCVQPPLQTDAGFAKQPSCAHECVVKSKYISSLRHQEKQCFLLPHETTHQLRSQLLFTIWCKYMLILHIYFVFVLNHIPPP